MPRDLTLKAPNQLCLLADEKLYAVAIELCQHECLLTLALVLRLPYGLNFSGTLFALLYKS